MTINKRIRAFVSLGNFLKQFNDLTKEPAKNSINELYFENFWQLISNLHVTNPWFTSDNVLNALAAIAESLNQDELVEWTSFYIKQMSENLHPRKVAVIMAGNIPMVGFHDMLCVLISGNKFIGKLSKDDNQLLPFLTKVLVAIEPEFGDYIFFTDGKLNEMDAVIATGSNNTARYFEYYFGKYPHIIRKNRNSVAVITGAETLKELNDLGNDIFRYFGLGCRNVSKIFVPKEYNFNSFFESIYSFNNIVNNNKYGNNYDYNRTLYLMSTQPSLLDNNFLLLKEDESYTSPIGVLFYEFYENIPSLNKRLIEDRERIQCIVSNSTNIPNVVMFGKAQCPTLQDYADGVDTMDFLINL